MKFICKNEVEMTQVSNFLYKEILKKSVDGVSSAIVVGLHGDLGSGKTTFTKNFAKKLGILEEITSPTFVVQRRFEIPMQSDKNFPLKNLLHFDMYRIESIDELPPLGFNETISNKDNLIFIEWPEKITQVLPKNIIKMNFTFIDENTREVEILSGGFLEKCLIFRTARFLFKKIKNVFKK